MTAVPLMTAGVRLKTAAVFLVAAIQALFAAAGRAGRALRSKRDSLCWNCLRPGGWQEDMRPNDSIVLTSNRQGISPR